MATHSTVLAWRVSWTEGPARLQSMGSQIVGHDWGPKRQKHGKEWVTRELKVTRNLKEFSSIIRVNN